MGQGLTAYFLAIVNGWKDEVVDERDLIIYIDLLYSMAENFESDIDTEKTKLLFEKMEEIQKMENQFNKLGLVYEGIPIDDLSPAQVEQIKRKISPKRVFLYVFCRILVFVLAKLSSSIFHQKL